MSLIFKYSRKDIAKLEESCLLEVVMLGLLPAAMQEECFEVPFHQIYDIDFVLTGLVFQFLLSVI